MYTKEKCPNERMFNMSTAKAKTQNKSLLLRLLIVAFCVYMFISIAGLYSELAESRGKLAGVKDQIAETEDRIDEDKNLLENGTEQELIEKAARDKLGYVYPNEQVFVDKSGN